MTDPDYANLGTRANFPQIPAAVRSSSGQRHYLAKHCGIAISILAALPFAAFAASEPLMLVGVARFPPHVMETDGKFEGFDIDVWNEVSKTIEINSTFRLMPFEDLLEAVARGTVDVAVAGISITHGRELEMDFSYPYMNTGLRILTSVDNDPAILRVVRSLSTGTVLWPVSYLLAFIVCCAHVLYFAERGSPAIDDRYFPGILEAAWCVLATITTVGYGDVAPRGWLGRFVAFFVMAIGISLFGIAIAQLSSGLMVEHLKGRISSAEDLRGLSVATVAGSTSAQAALRYESRVHEVAEIEEGYRLLRSGEVDAVLFDAAPLMRYAKADGNKTVSLVGALIEPQVYGIAFPAGSTLRESVNRALLVLEESGEYNRIYARWFGVSD